MTRRGLAIVSGLFSIAACGWSVVVWCTARYLSTVPAADPAVVLTILTIALPLSIFAGVYWQRWMFGVSLLLFATVMFVGLRLH